MSNKDLTAQLAAITARAVNDDPHNEKAAKKKSAEPAKKKAVAKPRRVITEKAQAQKGREKMSATISPAAIEALKGIELFLINECGERRMNTSAAVDVALRLAGESLTENKERIQEILTQLAETDSRRKMT